MMVTAASSPILELIRRAVGDQRTRELPDPDLLQRFHAQHDQAAFHALLLRHGPMVLDVCRGVLGNEADAEDAFQATFLILARKAGSIRKGASLGSWLHGVAYRTALKARAQSAARQQHEARVPPRQASEPEDLSWRELRQVLHEELSGLPERYRAPLVLCYLEGATQEAAAEQLGVANSTLRERLERGRALLRTRLVRRGLGPAAVLVAAAWPAASASAGLPVSLIVSTVKAASLFAAGQTVATGLVSANVGALTEGVLKAMSMSKLKTAIAVVMLAVVACCGIAAALAAQPTLDDRPPADPPPKVKADAAGDPLPPGAIARLGSTRLRHGTCVTAVVFSPDGKRIASTGWDWSPRVWDAETGEQVYRLLGHQGVTWCVAFSPDGKRLAGGGGNADPTVRVWNLGNGKEIWAAKAHQGPVRGVAFAPDGKSVVSVGGDGTVAVWEAATGKEVRRLQGHVGEVHDVAVAPGGKLIASAGADRTVRLWDLTTGKEVRKLEGHQTPALAVAFTADGKALISSGTGEVIRWDPATGKELVAIRGHKGQDRCVAVAPDGKAVVTANETGTLTLWDEAGKELRRIAANPDQWAVAFSPNGKLLASGGADCRVRVWDPATGKEVRQFAGHDSKATAVACSPDGKRIASGSLDQTVRLWDRATGKELRRLVGHEGGVLAVAFAPDGKRVASGGLDKVVRLWDAQTGKEVAKLAGHAGAVSSLAFTPDGKTLATGGGDRTVRLWDLAAGKEVYNWTGQKGEEGPVESVAFSPDGKLLASAGHDQRVHLWDVASKKEVHQLASHKRVVLRVAFARDGKSLGSAGGDGKVVLWEVATGKARAEYGPHYKGDAYSYTLATFTPDGRYFITGNRNRIRVWDPAIGKLAHTFSGHQGWLRSIVVTPDGGTIITGSEDTTVLLWDLAGALKDLPRPPALGAGDLKRLWSDLAHEEAKRSFRAVARLATAPRPAMQLLQAELRPVPPPDAAKAKEIARLITQLGSAKFNDREKATAELEKLGGTAEPALRKVLEGDGPAEVRRRVQLLLEKLGGTLLTADQLRTLRALEVLGRLGTPEARKLLEALADGAPGAWLTAEARAILRSLDGKPGTP